MTAKEINRPDRIEGQIAAAVVALRLLMLDRPQNDGLIDALHDQIDALQLQRSAPMHGERYGK